MYGTAPAMTEMFRGAVHGQGWYAGLPEVLSELGIGLVVGDPERAMTANKAFCSLSGYPPEELVPLKFVSLFPSDGDVAIERAAKRAPYETEILHRDGHRVPVEMSARVVLKEGQTEFMATFRDLTDRKRVEAELAAHARQQAVVAELGRQALVDRDLSSLLDGAVAGVARTLDAEYAAVLELQADGDALLLRAGVGWAEGVVGKATVGTGLLSPAGYTLASDSPLVVEDLSRETRFGLPPLLSHHGVVATVSVVLRGEAEPFGVLAAYTGRSRSFTLDDVHFLRAVANVLADAVARAAVENELATRARQQAAVAELGRHALADPDLFSLLDAAVLAIARTLDVDCAEVLELLPGGDTLLLRTGVGWEGLAGQATVGAGLDSEVGYTLASDSPVVVQDLSRETRFTGTPLLVRHGVVSGMSVVILGAQRPWGVLGAHTTRRRRFSADDTNFLQATANVVAEAIGRAEVEGALRAAHDRERRLRQRLESHSRLVVEAQEGERRRIARELHDEIGQALTGLKLTLEHHERLSAGEAPGRLERAQALTAELLQRVHDLSLDLRPAMLDDLGLRPALLWLGERFGAQTGVEVAVHCVGLDGRLRPEVETAAYRIVQEALTNVARHAGVHRAIVRGAVGEDSLSVEVADEGIGFHVDAVPPGKSSGLAGMEERARSAGGRMFVQSERGHGTRVVAELPLDNRPRAEL